jgi:transposase-like protein
MERLGEGRYVCGISRRSKFKSDPFRYFNSSPEVIRLVVMMYVQFPLSLRNVEDMLFERGIDICHETVRLWWNRFGRYCQVNLAKFERLKPPGFSGGGFV